MSEGMQSSHCDGCASIDHLRKELNEKHAQNRADIHRLRNDAQHLVLQLADLKGKILPIIGNGHPGVLAQIAEKLDELAGQVTDLRIQQGADTGRRGEYEWLRGAIATAIVGLLLLMAQRFWK